MRVARLTLVTLLPLGVLLLGFLWLQHSAQAALPGELSAAQTGAWPPLHEDLSASGEVDSGGADIDAYEANIVVVWAEGEDAWNPNGIVRMAWKRGVSDVWRAITVSLEHNGFIHSQPAVALAGATAHVVWVREDTEDPGEGDSWISYARCDLTSAICTDYRDLIPQERRTLPHLAPDVAVDPSGVPHAVWVEQDADQMGSVWYSNRVGGSWSSFLEQVSGGSVICPYTQDNPVIAADANHVYVAWDENLEECDREAGTTGIYFRQRADVTSAAGSGTDWEPDGIPWGKQLSEADPWDDPRIPAIDPKFDGFPTVDAGNGWVYVMWERFVVSRTIPFYGAVYTYSLAYRVYTGTLPQGDWWPGGLSSAEWAVVPFTSTSAADTGDYYAGVRPSLKMVGQKPHVVWHQWYAPSLVAAGLSATGAVDPAGQLDNEHNVNRHYPYKVSYATYREGTDPGDLETAKANWVSTTLRVFQSDNILAWADLALASVDGGSTYDLHVALHRRRGFVSADDSYAWDVWYTNEASSYRNYLPVLFK